MTDASTHRTHRCGDERRRTTSCARAMPKRRGHDSVARRQRTGPSRPSLVILKGLVWMLGWARHDQHLRGVPATRLPQHHCNFTTIPAHARPPLHISTRSPDGLAPVAIYTTIFALSPRHAWRPITPISQTRDETSKHRTVVVWNVLSFAQFKEHILDFALLPHEASRWAIVRTKRSSQGMRLNSSICSTCQTCQVGNQRPPPELPGGGWERPSRQREQGAEPIHPVNSMRPSCGVSDDRA